MDQNQLGYSEITRRFPQVHHRDEELHLLDQGDADGRAVQVDAALSNGNDPRAGEHPDLQPSANLRQHRNTL